MNDGPDWRRAAHDLRQPLAAAEMYAHLLTSRLAALAVDPQDPAWDHARVVAEQLRLLAQALDQLVKPDTPQAGGSSLLGNPDT